MAVNKVSQHEIIEAGRKGSWPHCALPRRRMTSYERSLDDERNGRVNHYENSEEFFKKMGI